MLDALFSSKTRLKLLLRFFLNPKSSAYLRGLEQEFHESTNSIRVELNRFENAGLILSEKRGNKKIYRVNSKFPMYSELHALAIKHFGIDRLVNNIILKLGEVKAVYLTGDMARGLDAPIIDITIIGNSIDIEYLAKLVKRAEKKINRRIRYIQYNYDDDIAIELPHLLIYGDDQK